MDGAGRYGGAPQCSAATLKGRYQRLCEAIIRQHCDSCAARAACRVWEAVVQRRLQWAIWCECATCGPTEEFGWDETPPESRQALLDQCGVFRLRVSPGTQFSRVRLMKELRAMGVSMAEVSAAMDDLLSAGVTGTEVEMQLLAMKLQGSGVETAIAKVSSGSE